MISFTSKILAILVLILSGYSCLSTYLYIEASGSVRVLEDNIEQQRITLEETKESKRKSDESAKQDASLSKEFQEKLGVLEKEKGKTITKILTLPCKESPNEISTNDKLPSSIIQLLYEHDNKGKGSGSVTPR